MEKLPKDRLNDKQQLFFKKLKDYMNEPMYFYGSCCRFDYIPGKSDIDIYMYTNDIKLTYMKLKAFLKTWNEDAIVVQRHLYTGNNILFGRKIKYNSKDSGQIEIVIKDIKYKDDDVKYLRDINTLPLYITILLYILKWLYYYTPFISKYVYLKTKRNILNNSLPPKVFIMIK